MNNRIVFAVGIASLIVFAGVPEPSDQKTWVSEASAHTPPGDTDKWEEAWLSPCVSDIPPKGPIKGERGRLVIKKPKNPKDNDKATVLCQVDCDPKTEALPRSCTDEESPSKGKGNCERGPGVNDRWCFQCDGGLQLCYDNAFHWHVCP